MEVLDLEVLGVNVVGALVILFLFGFWSATLASTKGRGHHWRWFLIGFLLGPIGVLLVLVVPTGKVVVERAELQAARPSTVGTAVKLLYIAYGIGFLRVIVEAGSLLFPLLFAGIMCFLAFKIGKGRNWARISVLVLSIMNIPVMVYLLKENLPANPNSGLLGIAQIAILLIALVFLFQRPSSKWFREMKAANG